MDPAVRKDPRLLVVETSGGKRTNSSTNLRALRISDSLKRLSEPASRERLSGTNSVTSEWSDPQKLDKCGVMGWVHPITPRVPQVFGPALAEMPLPSGALIRVSILLHGLPDQNCNTFEVYVCGNSHLRAGNTECQQGRIDM